MKKISELRKENGGLTQGELARELGVTQATISRWEKDQLSISGENIIKLALFFNASADDLLGMNAGIEELSFYWKILQGESSRFN